MILAFLQGQGNQIVTDAERDVEHVDRVLPFLQALPAGDLVVGGERLQEGQHTVDVFDVALCVLSLIHI